MTNVAAAGGQALVNALLVGLIVGTIVWLSKYLEQWRKKQWAKRHFDFTPVRLEKEWAQKSIASRRKSQRFFRWLIAIFLLAFVAIVYVGIKSQQA